jgi:DNA-binding protein HU-beta
MNKSEFVDSLAKQLSFRKQEGERVVEAVLEILRGALAKGEDVDLRGLGSFKVKENKARQGSNPRTGKPMLIKAKRTAAFGPGKEVTDLLNSSPSPDEHVREEAPS